MIFVLRDRRQARIFSRCAGEKTKAHIADSLRGIQIDHNTDIAWERFVHILGKVDAISCIVDKIMTVDPRLTGSYSNGKPCACGKVKASAIVILNAVTDNAAEIVTEILGCVGSVEVFCVKKAK